MEFLLMGPRLTSSALMVALTLPRLLEEFSRRKQSRVSTSSKASLFLVLKAPTLLRSFSLFGLFVKRYFGSFSSPI
jgi:hypothetical protein